MRYDLSLALLALALEASQTLAIRFPFHVKRTSPDPTLQSRASPNVTSDTHGITVKNSQNVQYIGNISLGGSDFNVVLDTGSSDLWVAGSVPTTQDTGTAITLYYAIGAATGNINTATLILDDYTIQNQAYVLVTDTSTFSTNIESQGYSGLIGLGPNTGSVIRNKLDKSDTSGDAPLFRIFEQNGTSSNFLTILLNRVNDPGENFTGIFTISELVSGYENITSQTQLKVKDVPTLTDEDQHWAVLTDANGVIGPDGNVIEYDSNVPSAPSGQLVAVLDSGFSYSQVPRDVSDAIYGRVKGAEYDIDSQLWLLPCETEVNITFKFGGVSFPVHPLDTVSDDIPTKDSSGNTVCVGTYQPITSAFSLLGEYDMILGMSFLRNAYTLIDFGNFVEDSGNDREDPYVQLLPLTTASSAHADFVKVRLNGVDTTATQTLLPASQESHSPESSDEEKEHAESKVLRYWPYIAVGCLVGFFAALGACIWGCCRRIRRRRAKAAAAAGGIRIGMVGGKTRVSNPYQPLRDPAPMVQQWRDNERV